MLPPLPVALGAGASHVPLLGAAVKVALVRFPDAVLDDFDGLVEGAAGPAASRALCHAAQWLAAKCAEPVGLACWHQNPETGELQRLPPSALWRTHREPPESPSDDANTLDQVFALFQTAAEDALGVREFDPRLQIVVVGAELDALLEQDKLGFSAWLANQRGEVLERLRTYWAGPRAAGLPEFIRILAEQQLETGANFAKLLTDDQQAAAPHSDESRARETAKEAVSKLEAEFLRRWAAGEFGSPAAARQALLLQLNSRPDGTVSRPGERDHYSKGTVERLTRGWFPRR